MGRDALAHRIGSAGRSWAPPAASVRSAESHRAGRGPSRCRFTDPRGWPTGYARSRPASPPRSGATCRSWSPAPCLAPGRRTVTAALRVTGLERSAGFAVHHRVLSAARWSARAVAHRLLLVLVAPLVPDGPVVVGIDDTVERRRGTRIRARDIYRDPVR